MRILTIMTLLGFTHLTLAQNYLYLNPEWKEYFIVCGGGNPYCSSLDYTISLENDTSINGITYYKTKREGIHTVWDWTVDTLVSEEVIDDYAYPIREDQGRFYIYNTYHEEEQLLHDFNLSIGDTAVSSSSCPNPQIVMEIDTVYFGTQMRKKFIFTPQLSFGNSPLFEGIGTSRGLFERPCSGVIGIEYGSILQCYTRNDEVLQIDTSGQCETTLPVNVKAPIFEEFNIYPNPFDENIIIENSFPQSSMINIRLYDFYGNLVQNSSKLNNGNMITISTKTIEPGIYILNVNTDNKFYTAKIIKL